MSQHGTGGGMHWMGIRNATSTILLIFMFYLIGANEYLFADTRYVSDRLIISIRSGQDNSSDILGYIQSDTLVDVLEEDGRYLKIKAENGLEGWVNAQYITSKKPNALIIKDLQAKVNHLQGEIEAFENSANDSSASISSTKLNYEKRITELERTLEAQQQTALNKERELEALKKENVSLKSEINGFTNPVRTPVKLKSIHWFLVGAGVLLFGFMVGRFVRKEKRKGYL